MTGRTGCLKTRIPVLDETAKEAGRAAQKLGLNRSQFYTFAAQLLVDQTSKETAPSPEAEGAITDLNLIVAHARMVWDDAVVHDWLQGHNAFLGGATPLEMMLHGHTAEVLEAISSEAAGVYA